MISPKVGDEGEKLGKTDGRINATGTTFIDEVKEGLLARGISN